MMARTWHQPGRVEKNIYRLDDKVRGLSGYQVRIRRQNRSCSKYFGDQRYGGAALAYYDACRYLQAFIRQYRPFTVAKYCALERCNNTTGTVGVRYEVGAGRYVAAWVDRDGRRHRARFPVHIHGETEAFRLALLARQQGVAALPADHYLHVTSGWVRS